MKRETLEKHITLANDLMYYIYTHIDTDINLDELSQMFSVNKYHMHKIFKSVFGRNIYESIKSIRLQKASNLLLTNRHSTISTIANACGYSSQTSFIRAFKERFSMTPKRWKNGGYATYSNRLMHNIPPVSGITPPYETIDPIIVKQPSIQAYYIRDRGYGKQIKHSWQKIQTLIYTHDLSDYTLISLFHDNPAITPLHECHHVAAIATSTDKSIPLPSFHIAKGVYVRFALQGNKGDLLRFIQWVYHTWLPQSGYETTTKPPYAMYRKNHHLSDDGLFDMDFYLSVTL
ncbi:MAG: AraC family transcriptional regulator [Sulfurovum sp.]|nr:AraC family transcriptional regulator [Sulfurovum sp.]